MIRSICLNPVIDRMYFINHFQSGNLYRDNQPRVYSGGKGVNVAKVVAALGEKCAIYGFVAGSSGNKLRSDLISQGIRSRFIEIPGETRTTINIIDREKTAETEILELGPAAGASDLNELLQRLKEDIVRDDIVICSGTIIPGAALTIYRTISQICDAKQGHCFIDTYGEILRASTPGNYFLAKPNLKEFMEHTGMKEFGDERTLVKAAGEMMAQGFTNIMISMGRQGALLLNRNQTLQATLPVVSHQSTVGSGDASVAGFATGISRGYGIHTAFALAMACGVSNAMHQEVGYIVPQEVEELMKAIRITG
jgi:tagatose 6-phosphate kinase